MPVEQWYYRLDGKPHGPFTVAQFEKLIRGRAVEPDTEVSNDGLRWRTLRAVYAGEPADPPDDPADWMTAQTHFPDENSQAGEKPDPPA